MKIMSFINFLFKYVWLADWDQSTKHNIEQALNYYNSQALKSREQQQFHCPMYHLPL